MDSSLRIAVVLCRVLEDEIGHLARDAPQVVHLEHLPQGLHDDPPRLRLEVQAAIDRVEANTQADVIVLGYGVCSRGTEGLRTSRCRLVMPRAHDCITLLLGSKERYAQYVSEHPGTYWYSPGWNRHHLPPGPERHARLLADYRARFGDDNARYLMETEQHWFHTYDRATWVDLGVTATEADVEYSCRCARWLGWQFDQQKGNPDLLRALVTGPWDVDRFLVPEPGQGARLTDDARIVEADAREATRTP